MKLVTATVTALVLATGAASASDYVEVTRALPADEIYAVRDQADLPGVAKVTTGTDLNLPADQLYAQADLRELGLNADTIVNATGYPTFDYDQNPATQR